MRGRTEENWIAAQANPRYAASQQQLGKRAYLPASFLVSSPVFFLPPFFLPAFFSVLVSPSFPGQKRRWCRTPTSCRASGSSVSSFVRFSFGLATI